MILRGRIVAIVGTICLLAFGIFLHLTSTEAGREQGNQARNLIASLSRTDLSTQAPCPPKQNSVSEKPVSIKPVSGKPVSDYPKLPFQDDAVIALCGNEPGLDELCQTEQGRKSREALYKEQVVRVAGLLEGKGGILKQAITLGHSYGPMANVPGLNTPYHQGISYWNYFAPLYSCPLRSHLGNLGDGGKWMCGVQTMLQRKNCVIYSFGSNGQIDFEVDALAATTCDVHVFDPTLSPASLKFLQDAVNEPYNEQRVWFHGYGLTGKSQYMSLAGTQCHNAPFSNLLETGWLEIAAEFLPMEPALLNGNKPEETNMCRMIDTPDMMRLLGHEWIDVWKMDVEGGEFDVLKAWFAAPETMKFTQLQFEVHYGFANGAIKPADKVMELLQGLQDNNMHSFFLEVNHWHSMGCTEMSYIKIDPDTGLVINGPGRNAAIGPAPIVRGWNST